MSNIDLYLIYSEEVEEQINIYKIKRSYCQPALGRFFVLHKNGRCVMELITVTEYYGNDFVSERKAYYFGPGHIEYIEQEPERGGDQDNERL